MGVYVLPCPVGYFKGTNPLTLRYNEKLKKELQDYYTPCEARFNRDGLYLDRQTNHCWFEFDGRAYTHRTEDFLWDFKTISAGELDYQTQNLILDLVSKTKLANKKQKSLARHILIYRDLRKNKSRIRLNMKKMSERINEQLRRKNNT